MSTSQTLCYSKITFGIDPGKSSGIALFVDGILLSAKKVNTESGLLSRMPVIDEMMINLFNKYGYIHEINVVAEDQYYDNKNPHVMISVSNNATRWEDAFVIAAMHHPMGYNVILNKRVLSRVWHTSLGIPQEVRTANRIGKNARDFVCDKFGHEYASEDMAQAICIAYASNIGLLDRKDGEIVANKILKSSRKKKQIKKIK